MQLPRYKIDIFPTWCSPSLFDLWFCVFKYFFCPLISSPSVITITHMLRFLQFPHNSWIFCSVFYIIFLFSLGGSCWHIFKITVSFLSHAQYTDEPIKGILHFCYSNFFVSNISFWIFLRVSISLFILPTHSYMLSTFYIRTLSIRGNWGINCS